MALNNNPISQTMMAKKLNLPKSTLRYHLKKSLNFSLISKPKVHELKSSQIKTRYKRAWPLYLFLQKNLNKIICTDEKLYHLTDCNKETKRVYIKKDQNRSSIPIYKKLCNFSKSVMVWAGISMKGKTKLYFIEPGVKINAKYYINNILKPFIEQDIKYLYPQGDGILQQDSAQSHTSLTILKYLADYNIKFILPSKWTPYAPDNSLCDY